MYFFLFFSYIPLKMVSYVSLLALFIVTLLVERKIIANKIANAAMVLLAFWGQNPPQYILGKII